MFMWFDNIFQKDLKTEFLVSIYASNKKIKCKTKNRLNNNYKTIKHISPLVPQKHYCNEKPWGYKKPWGNPEWHWGNPEWPWDLHWGCRGSPEGPWPQGHCIRVSSGFFFYSIRGFFFITVVKGNKSLIRTQKVS